MPDSPDISDQLQRAIIFHQTGQLDDAEKLYREIIAAMPAQADANHNLALLMLHKDAQTAVGLFRTALESDPTQGQYWLSYIEALIHTGELGLAEEALQTAENCGLDEKQSGRLRSLLATRNAKAPEPHEVNQFVTLFTTGRIAEAEQVARRLTHHYPGNGTGWKALGAALAYQANWGEALPALKQAAELLPGDAESHFNLGLAYQQHQDFTSAESAYFRALSIRANYAEAYNNLGLLYDANGQNSKAVSSFQKAISVKADFAQAYNNLGLSLHRTQQYSDAIAQFHQAIQLQPNYAEAYNNLAASLQAVGALAEAEAMARKSIAINPLCASSYNNLGNLLQETGRLEEAEDMLKKALEINSGLPDAYNNLGNLYQGRKKYGEAYLYYQRAVELNPNDPNSWSNLGTVSQALGEFHQAIACYQKALEIDPHYHNAHSNLLFALNYLSENAPEKDFELAVRYGESVAEKASRFTQWNCERSPSRLRVGIVSGDMLSHPVGYFLENVVKEINPESIELFAYATHHQEDALTERIRPRFAQWRSIYGIPDPVVASLIHDDAVHILIDLSGHTAFNRLAMFAYKAAPVQASWLGYFATTGVKEIDYLIADPWTLPVSEEPFFTEKIWRLPETRLCFTPPDAFVETSQLPALTNGYITFGCFNNLGKLNDEVVKTWAEILLATPTNRLMLKAPQLLEPATQEKTKMRFAQYGVNPDRLILEGPSSRTEYLKKYHLIDIALDPFPFTGGTTSAETLWMGVPVLTLTGDRFIGRQGVGLMENAGLHAWVAKDKKSYIELAIQHSTAITELAKLRNGLRQQVLDSPVFDAKRFAAHFEQALWGMWRDRRA